MSMQARYEEYKSAIECSLEELFTEDVPQKRLYEAMRYSLLAGGKRIRPVLTLEFCRACGGDWKAALPLACAVEMLHTYSLIHDDLPCMDNDDLRRGKPTNHVVFGETVAVLAGDALQAAAFETILEAPLSAEIRAEAARVLARAAGEKGICGGQLLDMEGEKCSLSLAQIEAIHEGKTASMIVAAALMGCAAGGAGAAQKMAAEGYARALGLAVQIRDDILDNESTEEELGKPIGSDVSSEKSTFYSLLGAKRCKQLVAEKTGEAKASLQCGFAETEFLSWLADTLSGRMH